MLSALLPTIDSGDRPGSRTKVRIAVPLAATCGTLWPLIPWLFDSRGIHPVICYEL